LPYVDVWNTWFDWYGNTAEGFRSKRAEIEAVCERVGREPTTLERSACMLVRLRTDIVGRPDSAGAAALQGSHSEIAEGLHATSDAGADEVIVVCDPITEASVHELAEILQLLRPKRPSTETRWSGTTGRRGEVWSSSVGVV
jgi:alkanesulfonate monooxygenase SsuD/methylene tetrahydromethanopterin reductase-like flavin-dependent oxidoreductase (luciferase family)